MILILDEETSRDPVKIAHLEKNAEAVQAESTLTLLIGYQWSTAGYSCLPTRFPDGSPGAISSRLSMSHPLEHSNAPRRFDESLLRMA